MDDGFDERMIWLLSAIRRMMTTREPKDALVQATETFIEALQADRGLFFAYRTDNGCLIRQVARNFAGDALRDTDPRIAKLAERVYRSQTPLLVTRSTPPDEGGILVRELDMEMQACVPCGVGDERLGVFYADGRRHRDRHFTQADRAVVVALGEHAAVAIENARLFERASNDPLTGLANTSTFVAEVDASLPDASANEPLGVLLLDLDAFKRVNVAAGAAAGDAALADIAQTLAELVRADGLVARYGSDKFAVLLPPDRQKPELRLRDVAERARAALAMKIVHGISISACIGGIAFPQGNITSAAELIAAADDLLRIARARGTGEIEIASP